MTSGTIIVLPGAADSSIVKITHEQTIYIGRKAKTNLAANENCIVLPYSEISAKHAEIRCSNDGWTIVDNGSTNGTTINAVQLNPGKEYVLKDEDIVGIANYNLAISLPNTATSSPPLQNNIEAQQEHTHFQVKLINATILVADLKSFTSLMEEFSADPAIVMQVAGNVFARLRQEIERNNGQLEKIAGDAMMAYWSNKDKTVALGISCHKACSTALQLKKVINQIACDKNIWPFEKYPLRFDTALATGPVASGALGKSQGNPALLGDTANLAFRMEKLIDDNESGKIIVDQNTFDLAKENFAFKHLGEYTIKGRHNLVNVYELLYHLK